MMKLAPYYHSSIRSPRSPDGDDSPTEPRQHGLIARALDSLQLGLDAVERGRRFVVLVARVGQVLADDVEGIPELVEVAAEPPQARLDLARVLLDLEPPEPEHDHLEIRVETVRRDGDDVAAHRVGGGRVFLHP